MRQPVSASAPSTGARAACSWTLLDEFVEVESGKRNGRPELQKALAACKRHRAKFVIAKLDRLSRNLVFIAMLMDRKVDFVCCDNPTAIKFTIHILAAVAEHERDAISDRTKAALAAAKAKGKRAGQLSADRRSQAASDRRARRGRRAGERPDGPPLGARRCRQAKPSQHSDRERQAVARNSDHSRARSPRPLILTAGWRLRKNSLFRCSRRRGVGSFRSRTGNCDYAWTWLRGF
jgi:DNA invertase Pin-like site-specific DNA recombinase